MAFAFPSAAPALGSDLPVDYQKMYNDFNANLYSGPDYKGRHETNQTLDAWFRQLLSQWAREAPVDYSGAAQIGRGFDMRNNALQARLGAMGISGGAAAGATSGLLGQQQNAVADYYTRQNQLRQAQHAQQLDQLNQQMYNLMGQGLQRNIQQQYNKGGFWKDLLGIGGSVLGTVLGGPVGGAAGGKIGGLLGGGGGAPPYTGSEPYGQQAGAPYGTIDPSYNGPYQPNSYGANL